jgi:hypothetical protein
MFEFPGSFYSLENKPTKNKSPPARKKDENGNINCTDCTDCYDCVQIV